MVGGPGGARLTFGEPATSAVKAQLSSEDCLATVHRTVSPRQSWFEPLQPIQKPTITVGS